jgi:hypothetical protein
MNKPTLYFLRLFFDSTPAAGILTVTDIANPEKPKDRFPGDAEDGGLFIHFAAWMGGQFSSQSA